MTRDPKNDLAWTNEEIEGHRELFLEAQRARKEREREEREAEHYEVDLKNFVEEFVRAGGTEAGAKAAFEEFRNGLAGEVARSAASEAETSSRRRISQIL